jgi:hypothetical protein
MNFLIITLTILSLIALTTYNYKEGARNMYAGITMDMPIFQEMLAKDKDKERVLRDIHYFNNTTNLMYAWERLPS